MPKKSAKASIAKTVIIRNPKNKAPKEKVSKTPAATEQDWLAQEAAELPPVVPAIDQINMAMGRKLCVSPYKKSEFKFKNGKPFRVSRFYPGSPNICFDLPLTDAEQKMKTEFFATSDMVYVSLKPLEALTSEQLRDRLVEKLAEKKKSAKSKAA